MSHVCCQKSKSVRQTISNIRILKEFKFPDFHQVAIVFFCIAYVRLTVSASFSELEELLQALKWVQHCLTDAQSQQDVELIAQLLAKEDFRNAYTIFSAVSQQKSRVSPTSPLTAQAEDLCQEVRITVILKQLVKAESKHCVESFCCRMKSYGKVMAIDRARW